MAADDPGLTMDTSRLLWGSWTPVLFHRLLILGKLTKSSKLVSFLFLAFDCKKN